MNVITGNGFADPATLSFTYPNTTGISYSFTDDGYYEIARYRYVSNATMPNCIIGVMNWVHGTYDVLANGSLTMSPFGDGYQQIQDSCAAQSNFIENYNMTELYIMWQILQDPTAPTSNGYRLNLYQFDGSPLAPQYQISTEPNMLPTRALRNVSVTTNGFTTTNLKVSKRSNDAQSLWSRTTGAGAASLVGMAVLSVLL